MVIHLGKWQDAKWPDEVDCIITDPPYSERTHSGQRSGYNGTQTNGRRAISERKIADAYASITPEQAVEWAAIWAARVRYWLCVMCDHALIPAWSAGAESAGLYVFQPIPCVTFNASPRFAGDGPASGAVYMIVARTNAPALDSFGRVNDKGKLVRGWGSLPPAYQFTTGDQTGETRIGGKPLPLMQQIIRDYSRPGMLVADPCVGHATALVAALQAGRRVWGAECDDKAHAAATERLARVVAQPQLIVETVQTDLLASGKAKSFH